MEGIRKLQLFVAQIFLLTSLFAQTYTHQTSNTNESLRGVSTPSNDVAWASGTHGTYLRTTDGGKTWRAAQVPGAESLDFRDIEAFDSNIAYLLAAGPGEQSRIYKTLDAGRNWSLQFTNHEPKGFFDCMAFWDPDHGIALGDPVSGKFELIKTEDGGSHWIPIPADSLPSAIDGEGAFAASGTCITVQGKSNAWFATGGKAARVFRSNDAGKSWSVTDTPIVHGPDSAGIFSISFRDAQHGVIAGGDYKQTDRSGPNLAYTEDAGATWKLSPIAPQFYISAVSFSSGKLLVAGTSHAACASSMAANSWKKLWDLNLNALAVAPDGSAISVGPKGMIVRFESCR